MGILDFLTGGGSGPDKALKLKPKVTQKYGDPSTRQKALQQLSEMRLPEAVTVLLSRFTVTVDPLTTDADEKEQTFEYIKGFGDVAVAPIVDFLRKSDQASSWALRCLEGLEPEAAVTGHTLDVLEHLGATYTRDPEKKVVLLHHLEGKTDPRIPAVALPFLQDMSDDVKLAALKVLGPLKHEPARAPMLELLTSEDTSRRVQTGVLAALAEAGFGVQGFREKVEALVADPFTLDREGVVHRRGQA